MPNRRIVLAALLSCLLMTSMVAAQPHIVDLATVDTADGELRRVYGSTGNGAFGVPIATGADCDGDGNIDHGMASMLADPLGRNNAGEVYLIFGDGGTGGDGDTAGFDPDILKIAGDGVSENAGSEIWIDDVTGDGIGDLLICRQNYSPSVARAGAGALSIVVGGPALRSHAMGLSYLDLRNPPVNITVTTLIGASETSRLCIWARTGDVDGDGIFDIAVGADQQDQVATNHAGSVYVVRGGAHLASGATIDLQNLGTTAWEGDLARIDAPDGGTDFHFGATVQIADLDGNGRGEVLVAAALNRAGASLQPDGVGSNHGSGGTTDGTLYIAWDDNFKGDPWPTGFAFTIDDDAPGSVTVLDGGDDNRSFGEEILGGLDYDLDGNADLFIGDLVASPNGRGFAGLGHVIYRARDLKGVTADYDALPAGMLTPTDIEGAGSGDISSDTAMHGDFDGDGIADLATGSPHANPISRSDAGVIDILHGTSGGWPTTIDLANLPAGVRMTRIYGAKGDVGQNDEGDTLCYSGDAFDVDGDGRVDIVTNEMVGNGLAPGAIDVGNLLVISGRLTALFSDGFETGDTTAWSSAANRIFAARPLP